MSNILVQRWELARPVAQERLAPAAFAQSGNKAIPPQPKWSLAAEASFSTEQTGLDGSAGGRAGNGASSSLLLRCSGDGAAAIVAASGFTFVLDAYVAILNKFSPVHYALVLSDYLPFLL